MATPIPDEFKSVGPYIKAAREYQNRDAVIYYWVINYAVDQGLQLNRSSEPAKKYLISLVDELETIKKAHPGNESFTSGAAAESHLEENALRLFNFADQQDRQSVFNKNTVKSFYTSGILLDVLSLFHEKDKESEKAKEIQAKAKYAKWKATHIHNCLKNGQTPEPGPPSQHKLTQEEDDELTRELLSLGVKPEPTPRTTSIPSTPTNNTQHPTSFNNSFGSTHQPAFTHPTDEHTIPQNPAYGFQPYPAEHPQMPSQNFQPSGQSQYPPQRPSAPKPMGIPSASPFTGVPTVSDNLSIADYVDAQKHVRLAASALDYEDAKTALDYLYKAISVLQKQ